MQVRSLTECFFFFCLLMMRYEWTWFQEGKEPRTYGYVLEVVWKSVVYRERGRRRCRMREFVLPVCCHFRPRCLSLEVCVECTLSEPE